jgi:hypothetical protein
VKRPKIIRLPSNDSGLAWGLNEPATFM